MATMIPATVDARTPASERSVFDRLRLDPAAEGWVVLHSLGLARRGNLPFGEIDFVVLVPGAGVACLEVKGGRVKCRDGIWTTRDRFGEVHTLSRSPLSQARAGAFGLRDAVQREFGRQAAEGRLLFTALVVLPDVPAPPTTPEGERWEFLDFHDLRQQPISSVIIRGLEEEARRLGRRDRNNIATPAVLERLRDFLRPDFDLAVAKSIGIERSEERVLQLTAEQYDALDLFELNGRCLVEGAAGTGKTVLGLELARRCAAQGKRVLFFCYNRLLGQWLEQRCSEFLPKGLILAGTYHSCVRRLILTSDQAGAFKAAEEKASSRRRDLFDLIYPLYGQLALEEPGTLGDILIVDEGQDLLTTPVLDVLNDWLVEGLAGGRWLILGDFWRQVIYGNPKEDRTTLLTQYAEHFVRAHLTRNCRNTRSIGEEVALLSGFDSLPYRLDDSDCLPVDYRYWSDADEERQALEEVLDDLLSDGVRMEEVVVLSPKSYERSVASKVRRHRVRPLRGMGPPAAAFAFSTIYAFKGLESAVVVICDLERLDSSQDRSLLYVGMSRARSYLILVLSTQLQGAIAAAVDRKLLTGVGE